MCVPNNWLVTHLFHCVVLIEVQAGMWITSPLMVTYLVVRGLFPFLFCAVVSPYFGAEAL
jgi:hypothetical protein